MLLLFSLLSGTLLKACVVIQGDLLTFTPVKLEIATGDLNILDKLDTWVIDDPLIVWGVTKLQAPGIDLLITVFDGRTLGNDKGGNDEIETGIGNLAIEFEGVTVGTIIWQVDADKDVFGTVFNKDLEGEVLEMFIKVIPELLLFGERSWVMIIYY